MKMIKTIELKKIIQHKFQGEGTGHDWYHIDRVCQLASYIQQHEGGNAEVITVSCLLHDLSDHKFNGGDFEQGAIESSKLLEELGYPTSFIEKVTDIVKNVSYKGSGVPDNMSSLEGKIVQDADRLDAIGAIGIARTFAYGGHIGQPIYDPTIPPAQHESKEAYISQRTHTVNHFYEKLLLLKDRMHTETARKIAADRHQLMLNFLSDFYQQWDVDL